MAVYFFYGDEDYNIDLEIEKMRAALLAQGADVEDMAVNITSDSLVSAQVIITTVPIIAFSPFLQKYFIKGVTLGAVKD